MSLNVTENVGRIMSLNVTENVERVDVTKYHGECWEGRCH